MKYRWSLAPSQPLLTGQLIRELPLSPLLAQCLVNRGVANKAEVSEFLNPRLKLLADPFLIPNMEAAIERLWKARSNNERLLIYGDYDVDGISSTALLVEVLTGLGWNAQPYLPGRFDDGYGLSPVSLEKCLDQFDVDVVLAVDCGSTAVEAIDFLNEKKIDVLVLDHHQVSVPPPNPVAMVNPQLSDDYPNFQELCSVGLAFKLEEGRFGQLTYMRIYQGSISRGDTIFSMADNAKVRVPKLVRMHSNEMEEVESAGAGDIVAMFGVDCKSMDTFSDGNTNLVMSSMYIPVSLVMLLAEKC